MAVHLAVYLLIFVYFASDMGLRRGEKARQFSPDEADRKSTYRLVQAFGAAILLLLVAPLLNYLQLAPMHVSGFLSWLGVFLMILGILLRAWSTQVLGRFYTRTLLTTEDQHVVKAGPYRLVRHPGYSGSLLVWMGAGLASANWVVFGLVTLICGLAYLYRIHSEEVMLMTKFGAEYQAYMQHTRRLIPYIF